MPVGAADIDKEGIAALVVLHKSSCNFFVEWKEIQPVDTAFLMGFLPEVEILQLLWMLRKPSEYVFVSLEAFLEGAVVRIVGVLILCFLQKRRQSHNRKSKRVESMIYPCLGSGKANIAGNIGRIVEVQTGFTDYVPRDKIAKQSLEKGMVCPNPFGKIAAAHRCGTLGEDAEDVQIVASTNYRNSQMLLDS